jgi:hypothetical protein
MPSKTVQIERHDGANSHFSQFSSAPKNCWFSSILQGFDNGVMYFKPISFFLDFIHCKIITELFQL